MKVKEIVKIELNSRLVGDEAWGAYHLAKKSGNFGLRSNGKANFRKIFSEIVDNHQR